MKITWRKMEWQEFITFRPWAFRRRRVNGIPAYLHPIGFGLSIVRPIRQGFWIDEASGVIYAGFLSGPGNFHYVASNGLMRSDANWPEPALLPISFEHGCLLFKAQVSHPFLAETEVSETIRIG